jgi:glycosyltransferase involved in cell wall biosynthesis
MRILQVLLSPCISGATTLADQLAERWRASGADVAISYLDSDEKRGRLERWLVLRRAMRDFGPDVVVSHSVLPNVYARLAAGARYPVITVLHSGSDDYSDLALRMCEWFLGGRTSRVVAVSQPQAKSYLAYFPRRKRRLIVVPNGVRDDINAKNTAGQTPNRVGVTARVDTVKRPDVWVNAAKSVLRNYSSLQFNWWGPVSDGWSEQEIAAIQSEDDSIRFHGATSRVPEALRSIDIYFHTADWEAFSISILEAGVAGLPVVCSDAVAATLPPGLAADTFRTGDASSAAAALERVIDDFPERSRVARARASVLLEAFSMERCAQRYLDVIDGVLKSE